MKIKLFNFAGKTNRKQKKKKGEISEKSKFAVVEAYKAARTNIMFSLSATNQKAVCVTSYSKGEGKSTASANLAISFSKLDKKVILIDCDLRRPNIHNILKLDNSKGFSDIIGKMSTFEKAVHRDVLPSLDVLTSGTIPPNPSELICSPAFSELVEKLNQEYDFIIFDTPPIGVVADALMMKSHVAGYILVLRERSSTHGDIEKMLENIKLADSRVLGFLKVGCDPKNKNSGKRGYYYY